MRNLIAGLVRELGYVDAALYVMQRIFTRISNGRLRLVKYYIYRQPLVEKPTGRGKAIKVSLADESNEKIFSVLRGKDVVRTRLADGSLCLLAEKDDDFLGFLWLRSDGYHEDEVRCHYQLMPEGNYSWDYDVYIAPKARFGFAFSRLWEEASDLLRSRGQRATISRINAFNARSIKSHERLGAVRIGKLLFLGLGRFQLMLGGFPPYLHLSFSPSSEPVVKIHVDPDSL